MHRGRDGLCVEACSLHTSFSMPATLCDCRPFCDPAEYLQNVWASPGHVLGTSRNIARHRVPGTLPVPDLCLDTNRLTQIGTKIRKICHLFLLQRMSFASPFLVCLNSAHFRGNKSRKGLKIILGSRSSGYRIQSDFYSFYNALTIRLKDNPYETITQ